MGDEEHMEKQLIISVGREFGSGGHIVAKKLAEKYGLPLYDKNILQEIAESGNLDKEKLAKYDEHPKNMLLSRTVRGYNNSPEENIAKMQFEYLREMATEGKSFVVLGRCAETVLNDFDALIPVFILSDEESKIARIADRENLSVEDAKTRMIRQNKKRKWYHNYYSKAKWGDSRYYDLCVNTTRIGLDGTYEMIVKYIEQLRNA